MRMFPLMAALDADGDGVISARELDNAAAALKTLDKNNDGKLTEEELRPNFGGPGGMNGRGPFFGGPTVESMVGRLMEMDKNGDGKLSKDELGERMQNILERADTDRDGFASRSEIEAMSRRDMQNRERDFNGRGQFDGRRPEGEPRRPEDGRRPEGEPRRPEGERGPRDGDGIEAARRGFEELDKNQNGVLSMDELPARLKDNVSQIDTNKNGVIELPEFAAALRGLGRGGDRPREGDRPQGDRPREGARPEGDRPQPDRPQGDRPQPDRPREGNRGGDPR